MLGVNGFKIKRFVHLYSLRLKVHAICYIFYRPRLLAIMANALCHWLKT